MALHPSQKLNCIHIHGYIRIHVTGRETQLRTFTCIHTLHAYTQLRAYTQLHAYTQLNACTYLHAYMLENTFMYMHICVCMLPT